MFKLDERLSVCAGLVRNGSKLADIGTDHAYLPVWLARNGKISSAIAADINLRPLERGLENIKRYSAEEIVTTRLSNGLQSVKEYEADDIVIAGMGAEMIVDIISKAEWLRCSDKHLILQPMTRANVLRKYLAENGFSINSEIACEHSGKVYSVMSVQYAGSQFKIDKADEYLGKLNMSLPVSKKYAMQVLKKLCLKRDGLRRSGTVTTDTDALIEKIEMRCMCD